MMTTSAAFYRARERWRQVSNDWTVKVVRGNVLYVHKSSQKVLPAFDGPISSEYSLTAESVLQFHVRKKRQAFHIAFEAYLDSHLDLEEDVANRFIRMTDYLDETHELFAKPCDGFLNGGPKQLDGHLVEFKALDDYGKIKPSELNQFSYLTAMVRSRMALSYLKRKQALHKDSAGLAAGPEDSAGLAAGPEDSAGLAAGPEDSAGLAVGPEIMEQCVVASKTPAKDCQILDANDVLFQDVAADESLQECIKRPIIPMMIKKLIDVHGLKEKAIIVQRVLEYERHIGGLFDIQLDSDACRVISDKCVKEVLPDFYADLGNSASDDQKSKHFIDSITPNKRIAVSEVREYDKVIFPMAALQTTPTMENLLSQKMATAATKVNTDQRQAGKNLFSQFNDCKSGSMISHDSDDAPSIQPIQAGHTNLIIEGQNKEIRNLLEKLFSKTEEAEKYKNEAEKYKNLYELGVGGKRKFGDLDSARLQRTNLLRDQFEDQCEQLTHQLKRGEDFTHPVPQSEEEVTGRKKRSPYQVSRGEVMFNKATNRR